jgi:hypothetical protein
MSPFSVITNTISVRLTSGQLLILSQAAFSNAVSDRLEELPLVPEPPPKRERTWEEGRPFKRRKC